MSTGAFFVFLCFGHLVKFFWTFAGAYVVFRGGLLVGTSF